MPYMPRIWELPGLGPMWLLWRDGVLERRLSALRDVKTGMRSGVSRRFGSEWRWISGHKERDPIVAGTGFLEQTCLFRDDNI